MRQNGKANGNKNEKEKKEKKREWERDKNEMGNGQYAIPKFSSPLR